MILRQINRVVDRVARRSVREYSFKAVKRPDFTSTSSKAFVEKKLRDFNLQQILRAKIEMSGPMTGK